MGVGQGVAGGRRCEPHGRSRKERRSVLAEDDESKGPDDNAHVAVEWSPGAYTQGDERLTGLEFVPTRDSARLTTPFASTLNLLLSRLFHTLGPSCFAVTKAPEDVGGRFRQTVPKGTRPPSERKHFGSLI
jgi:hypothetical protein